MNRFHAALVLAMLLNATANLLIKFGMRAIPKDTVLPGGLLTAFGNLGRNYWVILVFLGLCCFALNVLIYAYAMKEIPISIGYPFMTICGFAIIATVAAIWMGEKLGPLGWTGVVLAFVGVVLIASELRPLPPPEVLENQAVEERVGPDSQ